MEKFAAPSVDPAAQRLVEQFRTAFDAWRKTTKEILAQRASYLAVVAEQTAVAAKIDRNVVSISEIANRT